MAVTGQPVPPWSAPVRFHAVLTTMKNAGTAGMNAGRHMTTVAANHSGRGWFGSAVATSADTVTAAT